MICTDDIPQNECVVYSLGSRNDFSFDKAVVERFGCQVHTFDCTVKPLPEKRIPQGVSFYPWCVGDKDEMKVIDTDGKLGQYYTLSTIQRKLQHQTVDLLKMDIERHEFAVIQTLNAGNSPRQISFEVHLNNAHKMWGGPVSEVEWTSMWATLDGLGYGVFDHEPNPRCKCCCELSIKR